MNTQILEKHYGSKANAMKALGVYRQLWEHWRKNGIPYGRQCAIQLATRGKVKAVKRGR
jgi:hypothetical protein